MSASSIFALLVLAAAPAQADDAAPPEPRPSPWGVDAPPPAPPDGTTPAQPPDAATTGLATDTTPAATKAAEAPPIGTPLLVQLHATGAAAGGTEASDATSSETTASAAVEIRWTTLDAVHLLSFEVGTQRTVTGTQAADFAPAVLDPQAKNLSYDAQVAWRYRQYERYALDLVQSPFAFGGHPLFGLSDQLWQRTTTVDEGAAAVADEAASTELGDAQRLWIMAWNLPLMMRWDLAAKDRQLSDFGGGSAGQGTVAPGTIENDIAVRLEMGLTGRMPVGGARDTYCELLELDAPSALWGPMVTVAANIGALETFGTLTSLRVKGAPNTEVAGLTGPQVVVGVRFSANLVDVKDRSSEVNALAFANAQQVLKRRRDREDARAAKKVEGWTPETNGAALAKVKSDRATPCKSEPATRTLDQQRECDQSAVIDKTALPTIYGWVAEPEAEAEPKAKPAASKGAGD